MPGACLATSAMRFQARMPLQPLPAPWGCLQTGFYSVKRRIRSQSAAFPSSPRQAPRVRTGLPTISTRSSRSTCRQDSTSRAPDGQGHPSPRRHAVHVAPDSSHPLDRARRQSARRRGVDGQQPQCCPRLLRLAGVLGDAQGLVSRVVTGAAASGAVAASAVADRILPPASGRAAFRPCRRLPERPASDHRQEARQRPCCP